jgi:hypothetical protein
MFIFKKIAILFKKRDLKIAEKPKLKVHVYRILFLPNFNKFYFLSNDYVENYWWNIENSLFLLPLF